MAGPRIGFAAEPRRRGARGSDGHGDKDSLPEWSKGVDSSSTSASCVGSNPTAVMFLPHIACVLPWQVLGASAGGAAVGVQQRVEVALCFGIATTQRLEGC